MLLEGSCHCGSVRFTLITRTPYPYMRCYCTICRKTAGGGGYAINIMAEAGTLKVQGQEAVTVYRALREPGDSEVSEAMRHFCGQCGSCLWISDPRWPDRVYPFASAVDTPLLAPPEQTHIMEASRCGWAEEPTSARVKHCEQYPEESIQGWHDRLGLTELS